MSDKLYSQLRKHYDDALALEPTQFKNPFLTHIYKIVSRYVKHMPFRVLVPLSVIFSFMLYSVFGFFIIRIVSVFQHGF